MVANKLDLQKRQHRERSQPVKRARLGLLEKHADYVLRSRDFHSKEDRIKKLREKASGRNKDEFYFGMIRGSTQKGVHVQKRGGAGEGGMDEELVRVLKSQDGGYLRVQKAVEEGRINRLNQQLQTLIDEPAAPIEAVDEEMDDWDSFDAPPVASGSGSSGRKHTLFTDSLSAITSENPLALLRKRPPPPPTPSSSTTKRRARYALAPPTAAELAASAASTAAHRASLETLLAARQKRLSALSLALRELELQRLRMQKGTKKGLISKFVPVGEEGEGEEVVEKGVGTGARVWKWKSERKR